MTDQIKNMLIGMFVLAGCVIVIFILLFLHPTTGDEGKTFIVRFADIDKVSIGTRVTFAGRPVGEVASIREIEFGRDGKHDSNDRLYIFELTLKTDSNIRIYNTDDITLRTSGLLGERSVAIIPLAPKPGVVPRELNDKDIIYATQVGSIEDTMQELKIVAGKVDIVLDQLAGVFDEVKKEELIKKVSVTLENIQDITEAINQPDDLSSIVTNMQDFTEELASRLSPTWDKVDASLEQLQQASVNVNETTGTARKVVDDIAAGHGTAGKILVSDELYLQLSSVLSKADIVMDDINHYGLLFHSDKGWQRLRARQRNLMASLSSPQQFRNYFNDNLDQINATLSRVTMAYDQAKTSYPDFPLGCNQDFTKVYADLLRKVQSLENSLLLYNQQLMESCMQQSPCLVEK